MGKLARGKELLSAQVPQGVYNYIKARGKRLDDRSIAWVVQRIVDYWFATGAPPLSPLDAKLEPLPVPNDIMAKEPIALAAEAEGLYQASKGSSPKRKKP